MGMIRVEAMSYVISSHAREIKICRGFMERPGRGEVIDEVIKGENSD